MMDASGAAIKITRSEWLNDSIPSRPLPASHREQPPKNQGPFWSIVSRTGAGGHSHHSACGIHFHNDPAADHISAVWVQTPLKCWAGERRGWLHLGIFSPEALQVHCPRIPGISADNSGFLEHWTGRRRSETIYNVKWSQKLKHRKNNKLSHFPLHCRGGRKYSEYKWTHYSYENIWTLKVI